MSLELHVFIEGNSLPTQRAWQSAVDDLALPLALDSSLELPQSEGFCPCVVGGQPSGFEIYIDSAAELFTAYPQLRHQAANPATVLTFRWGGELLECACVLGSAAALVQGWKGLAYYPDDDLVYDRARLLQDFRDCLAG